MLVVELHSFFGAGLLGTGPSYKAETKKQIAEELSPDTEVEGELLDWIKLGARGP